MRILKENFETALAIAIRTREAQEAAEGPHYKSAFVAGLKAILEASLRGERITIEAT